MADVAASAVTIVASKKFTAARSEIAAGMRPCWVRWTGMLGASSHGASRAPQPCRAGPRSRGPTLLPQTCGRGDAFRRRPSIAWGPRPPCRPVRHSRPAVKRPLRRHHRRAWHRHASRQEPHTGTSTARVPKSSSAGGSANMQRERENPRTLGPPALQFLVRADAHGRCGSDHGHRYRRFRRDRDAGLAARAGLGLYRRCRRCKPGAEHDRGLHDHHRGGGLLDDAGGPFTRDIAARTTPAAQFHARPGESGRARDLHRDLRVLPAGAAHDSPRRRGRVRPPSCGDAGRAVRARQPRGTDLFHPSCRGVHPGR